MNFSFEKKLFKKGFKSIAGLDEAGRGAWAGPLVAASVLLKPKLNSQDKKLKEIKDSKKLSPKKREELFDWLINFFDFGIGVVSEKTIDRIGIAKANKLAMKKAIQVLKRKPDYLLIDGLSLNYKKIPVQKIIKGDSKVLVIAAASIIAKVIRDKKMINYHQKYPFYDFKRHKGYGTRLHYQLICQNGLCRLHRQSFRPMREMVKSLERKVKSGVKLT